MRITDETWVTAAELAVVLGLTVRRVNQLVEEDVRPVVAGLKVPTFDGHLN